MKKITSKILTISLCTLSFLAFSNNAKAWGKHFNPIAFEKSIAQNMVNFYNNPTSPIYTGGNACDASAEDVAYIGCKYLNNGNTSETCVITYTRRIKDICS